ncbi:phage tail protein [Sphingobium sp. AS12]|uniref:phage tail protein n=1 Tax=Sphingobium sp. AS12 TaxID=2849495 RepID=UPI001C312E9B|nr:phage tail protein [Sphingobium sp. AS12]MBV2148627.1 phage tail protein [Sphingobium sp. AS12]
MSKTLRTVAVIAGAVALVAATGGAALAALAPAGMAGTATLAGISAATLATVATVASVASTLASIGAQLTAKKPPARGTINQVIIAAEPVSPCIIGRTYSGGVLRHDVGYGPTLKKVKNPYRGMVLVYSVAGPIEEFEGLYLDFQPVSFSGTAATGYYASYLYRDFRLGLASETALTPFWAGMPNWTSAHKLSGKAAVLWNLKFDKDAKRYASGVPIQGAVCRGVKCYDPRKDDTYPGGVGSHHWADPGDTAAFDAAKLTWEWSECPGLQSLKYALGSWARDEDDPDAKYEKVFGVGLPPDGIIVQDFVTLSNICDANGWKVGGVVYEPGDRWANLKRILEAGAAEPMWRGGKLGLRFNAPRLSLHTLTADDLADEDVDATAQQTWAARLNGIRPKYRSEANKWEYVQSDLVSIASYLTEDGEEKIEEQQYDLIQQKNQAAQIAAYKLLNGRELAPIVVPCKPHMRHFGPGDMLTLDLPDHGLGGIDAIILKRQIDPARMVVTFTFMSESEGKHDFALGRTGTAPPTPALTTGEDRDDIATEIVRGADGFSVAPSSWVRAISCTYAGTPKTGQFPLSAAYYVYQGSEDISEDALTTFSLTTTNCVAALGGANDRVLTIDAMSADRASAQVTISHDGTVVSVASVNLTKVRDGGSVNSATDSTLSVNSSGSYGAVSGGPLTLNVGPDGTIQVDVNLNYGASSGTGALAGKIQYRTTPGSGSWTDMAAEESDPYGATVGEPSSLTLSASIAGPSSAADWEFQLLTRRSSGTGTLVALDGAMTVGWS